jgi:hypothetical protein
MVTRNLLRGLMDPSMKNEFLAEVPDIIPACVAGIFEFWKNRRTNPKPTAEPRSKQARRPQTPVTRDQYRLHRVLGDSITDRRSIKA